MKRVVTILSFFILMFLLVGCGSSSESSDTQSNEPKTFTVGDAAEISDVNIYLYQIGKAQSVPTTMGVSQTAPAGKTYLLTSWVIENNQDSDLAVSTENFECYIDDVLVDTSPTTFMVQDGFTGFDSLAPGKRANGFILYEIPETWTNGEISFKPNMFVDNSATFTFTPDQVQEVGPTQ